MRAQLFRHALAGLKRASALPVATRSMVVVPPPFVYMPPPSIPMRTSSLFDDKVPEGFVTKAIVPIPYDQLTGQTSQLVTNFVNEKNKQQDLAVGACLSALLIFMPALVKSSPNEVVSVAGVMAATFGSGFAAAATRSNSVLAAKTSRQDHLDDLISNKQPIVAKPTNEALHNYLARMYQTDCQFDVAFDDDHKCLFVRVVSEPELDHQVTSTPHAFTPGC